MVDQRLPSTYEHDLVHLLRTIGTTRGVEPAELTGFWPRVGHAYEGRLMVIGKAVNGWIDKATVEQLSRPDEAARFAKAMRHTAEPEECPMSWVTDAWGRRDGYSTARSAYWRFVRQALARVDPESVADPLWSGRLAWSNLCKVAPWSGGNPGGRLLEVQREFGPGLLSQEVTALDPGTILVTTGRWWFEPFAARLGLDVAWTADDLIGRATKDGRAWVVTPHPQGKSRTVLAMGLAVVEGEPTG